MPLHWKRNAFLSTLSFFWPKSRELVSVVFFLSGAAQSRDSLIAYFRVYDVLYTHLSYACYPTSYNWSRPGSLLRKGRPQRVPH